MQDSSHTKQNINRKKVIYRYYSGRIRRDLKNFFKWIVLAILTGVVVGGASSVFAGCIREVTLFRKEHEWLFLLLPVAGLLIVFMYQKIGKDDGGTNQVISTIKAKDDVPRFYLTTGLLLTLFLYFVTVDKVSQIPLMSELYLFHQLLQYALTDIHINFQYYIPALFQCTHFF